MAYNKKAVLTANAEAIRVVLRLEKEHRPATEAEKGILRGYQGFGGLKCVLNRTDTPADIRYWSKSEQELFAPTQQLKQMIYREAVDAHTAKRYWESIKASVLTSFYTDRRIVSAISDALATSGVTLKRCLDPSSGMGAFAETFAKQVGIVDALEKDLLTARISQALHPYGEGNIFVRNEPFEAIAPLEEAEKYDLVTSNIPFGDFMVYDREYSRGNDLFKKESTRAIHNYFFVKGLDCTREGGLIAFITSQGVLDAALNEPIRRYLMQNSRLISAIRLPSGMFSEQAGTEVGSDLIVLQKQSGKEIGEELEKQFVQTVAVPKGDGFTMAFNHNSLFEGSWDDVASRTIATSRELGRDPYGKPTWKYRFEGTMEDMAESLRIQLTQDVTARFDRKLYETGIAMSEEERQADLAPAPEGLPQAVDKDLIESYRLFMLRDLGNKESSVSNRLRHLHQVIRKALQEQYIREDPFDFIDIETPTYERNALTSDELHKLLSFRPHKSVDNHCRLIFLLGCFTGLAFSDLKKLRMDDVYTLSDGRRYISLCRTKTQNRCIIPLLPIAEEILSIVSGGRKEGLIFREFPTNSHFNRKIREIIIKAGLPPHTEATSHTARHTFATTICLENGLPIETVSKMLGHRFISTTELYAKVSKSKIAREMQPLMGSDTTRELRKALRVCPPRDSSKKT